MIAALLFTGCALMIWAFVPILSKRANEEDFGMEQPQHLPKVIKIDPCQPLGAAFPIKDKKIDIEKIESKTLLRKSIYGGIAFELKEHAKKQLALNLVSELIKMDLVEFSEEEREDAIDGREVFLIAKIHAIKSPQNETS